MPIKDVIFASDIDMPTEQDLFRKALYIQELLKTERGRQALRSVLTEDEKFLVLFNGASTRTDLTITNAIEMLGGRLHPRLWQFSSMAKGEPMSSLVHFCEGMRYQCLVMRHDGEEADSLMREAVATRDKKKYDIRFINAGMGNLEHPTQKLKDIFTIQKLFPDELLHGNIAGNERLRILFSGDVACSRTMHSLLKPGGVIEYNPEIWITSPEDNVLPDDIRQFLVAHNFPFSELHISLQEAIAGACPHILYLSRFQFNLRPEWSGRSKEEKEEYETEYARFIGVTRETLACAPSFMKILHPLPQGKELPKWVDDNPRAAYHEQQENGLSVDMALLLAMFAPHTDLRLLHQDKQIIAVHARTEQGTFSVPTEIGNISRLCLCQGCAHHCGQCTAAESRLSGTWGFVSETDFRSITGKARVFCAECRSNLRQ